MLKVLVVEDEELIRRGIVLTTDWASLDCVVIAEASNGEEGLKIALEKKPDIIIADIRMPKMDGLEMLKELRDNESTACVIILTSYSSFEYARSALRLGVFDFVLKPFHDGELEDVIRRFRDDLAKKARTPEPEPEPMTAAQAGQSRNTKLAIDYITQHYSEPDISVSSIAGALDISEGHLSHLFKRETGQTILGYLTRQRIHAAQELLKTNNYKVYEVCEKVGYRDITYFSSTFKKVAGVSPTEYQSQVHQER